MTGYQRKTKRIITTVLLLLSLLAFHALPVCADNEEYGTDAYGYLEYIDENLGYRITNVETTPDITAKMNAGAWIKSTLESFGYPVNTYYWNHEGDEIYSYSCEKPGNSPMKLVIGAHYDSVDTKGVEDNGTGVSMVLELAKRFYGTETPLTLEFCFFDGEETSGFAGSYDYIMNQVDPETVLCYVNIDCIGAGDFMFAYGGDYEEDQLVRIWPYYMAMEIAYQEGIDLHSMPEEVTCFRTPTRDKSSDHYYFLRQGVPYVYFEANRFVKPDGTLTDEEKPYMYNSAKKAFRKTNGQIIHTQEFEDLATLESIVPGRIQAHLTAYSKIISRMIREMSENSPADFAERAVHEAEETTESEETEEITETEETTAETESDTAPPESESAEKIRVKIETEGPETSAEIAEDTVPPGVDERPGEDMQEIELSASEVGGWERTDYILVGIGAVMIVLVLISVVQLIRLRKRKLKVKSCSIM